MEFPSLTLREYRADVLTQEYLLTGQLAPLGPLLAFLDQADRGIMTLKQAHAVALDPASQVGSFQADELIVTKHDVIAIRLQEAVTQATVHLLPRREKMLVFMPSIIIQAEFHCGPDTRASDLLEATPGRWATASEARIFPLRASKQALFQEAKILLVNKRHIRFYQPLK
jgi:hypothetical protein